MCGIVGYVGGRKAAQLLLDGLRRLEYRGYDSAGLAMVAPGASDGFGLEVIRRVLGEPRDIGYLVDSALAKAGLTDKEQAVARLILKGLTSVEIAELEGNSEKTVRQHVTQIYAKCGVASRAELFHFVFPW